MTIDGTIIILAGIDFLDIAFKVFSIMGIFILFWYTVETHRIRKNSERQLITSFRPYVAFLQDPNPYTLINKSNNIAQNVIQISKIGGQYFMGDEESIRALVPNDKIHFEKNRNKLITGDELRKRIPSIKKLVDYLDGKQLTCLVAVYEDLSGNKIFNISYGSGDSIDKVSETKYISDL